MRLNKRLSELGVCSRREADKLIAAGRVTVNKKAVELGQQVTEADSIELDGQCVNPHALNANAGNPEAQYLLHTESRRMAKRYGEQISTVVRSMTTTTTSVSLPQRSTAESTFHLTSPYVISSCVRTSPAAER